MSQLLKASNWLNKGRYRAAKAAKNVKMCGKSVKECEKLSKVWNFLQSLKKCVSETQTSIKYALETSVTLLMLIYFPAKFGVSGQNEPEADLEVVLH